MKKRLAGIVLALAALFAVVAGSTAPATAVPTVAQSTQSAQAVPADLGGWKFWSPSICIDGSGINGQYYRVAELAQQWNLRTTTLSLDYSDDCAADGYPPSRRMVVGSYNNPSDNYCWMNTNNQTSTVNGMKRWTNGPGIYINIGQTACVQNQAYRDHVVSAVIGWVLGANFLNSAGYNSRVMNMTTYSWGNVTTPDQNTANSLDALYGYAYCEPFGTAC